MTFDHDFGYSFPLPPKKKREEKRRMNSKNRDQQLCLSARSAVNVYFFVYYWWRLVIQRGPVYDSVKYELECTVYCIATRGFMIV